MEQDNNWYQLGYGGFANVYGSDYEIYAKKQLKNDMRNKKNISRFKREYDITKSLEELDNIIPVYEYFPSNYSYTMLRCDKTLKEYLDKREISDEIKKYIVDKILFTMEQVHNRGILHRDLSVNNVLLKVENNELEVYISDFGIGKSSEIGSSYQTKFTNGIGHSDFTAPEQLIDLKSSSKASDVFSLGRIINYIYTGSAYNSSHKYGVICEKACSITIEFRQSDAGVLRREIEHRDQLNNDVKLKEKVLEQIELEKYDENASIYIQGLSSLELAENIRDNRGYVKLILWYIEENYRTNSNSILKLVSGINKDCAEVTKKYEEADRFAALAFQILCISELGYDYELKANAADILKCAAFDLNRFYAQGLVDRLESGGIEPLILDRIKDATS